MKRVEGEVSLSHKLFQLIVSILFSLFSAFERNKANILNRYATILTRPTLLQSKAPDNIKTGIFVELDLSNCERIYDYGTSRWMLKPDEGWDFKKLVKSSFIFYMT